MIHYQFTNAMIQEIETIYRIRGVIENAKIVPEREQKLKHIARLRSGVYSTKIEGNRISYDEAERMLKGEKIEARPRDEKELKNYMNVLDFIESREFGDAITEGDIFTIHRLTTKNILDAAHHKKRRNQANAIYNEGGGIVYLPPDRKDVPKLITTMLEFINNKTEVSVLLRAALLHHCFVIIHPFIDGNGRTARALTQLFLYQNGFNTKKYFSLEEYYDSDLPNYYGAIFIGNDFYSAQKTGIDSSQFIEYFLKGLSHELRYLQKQIASISSDASWEDHLAHSPLTNRQVHIATAIKEQGSMTSKELLKLFNVSIATIKRDLQKLVAVGLLEKSGTTKAARYAPKISNN